MGIIHKLKEDVVQFVIEQKKRNPKISCRKLAAEVSDTFQTSVSKSAINNILYQSQMSSPVGRPAGSAFKYKKFKIPEETKTRLFPKEKKKNKHSQPIKNKEVTEKSKIPPPSSHSPPIRKAIQKKSQHKEIPRVEKHIDLKPAIKIKPKNQSDMKSGKSVYCEGLGSIFLKASEWELTSKSILGDLLRKFIDGEELINFDAAGETLLFLQPFGIKGVMGLSSYNGQGLWTINELKNRVQSESLINIINSIKSMREMALTYTIEASQLFKMLNCIKLNLEDGSQVLIDAQMTTVWPLPIQPKIWASTNKVMGVISKQILNNIEPGIFCCLSGGSSISQDSLNLIAAFSNGEGKKIKSITVNDKNNEEMAQFKAIPDKKRVFLAGIWPWQRQFDDILKNEQVSKKGKLSVETLHKEIFFSVVFSNFDEKYHYNFNNPLRVIYLQESESSAPFVAIATNTEEAEMSIQAAVNLYMNRWPYLQSGNNAHAVKTHLSEKPSNEEPRLLEVDTSNFDRDISHLKLNAYDIFGVTDSYLSLLISHGQQCFFPQNYYNLDLNIMKSRVYDACGHYQKDSQNIKVHLELNNDQLAYKDDFEYAIKRVNESAIFDSFGRKLLISL